MKTINMPSSNQRIETVCSNCNQGKPKPLWNGPLQKCVRCGFVWAPCDIPIEEIHQLYQKKDYFFGEEYLDYIKEKPYLQKLFNIRLKPIRRLQPQGRLLDVGSAYGFFLEVAKPYYQVEGAEISPDATHYSQNKLNLNVHLGDLLSLPLPESSFDVITCWATIEHLAEPHRYVEKISTLLKPGGIFACSTGDIESPLPWIQKNNWRLIHPPTHLSYFSKRSLSYLLRRYQLNPVYSTWSGEYRSIDGMLYAYLVLLKKRLDIYEQIKKLGLNRGGFYLNTFDTIYIIAQKEQS